MLISLIMKNISQSSSISVSKNYTSTLLTNFILWHSIMYYVITHYMDGIYYNCSLTKYVKIILHN